MIKVIFIEFVSKSTKKIKKYRKNSKIIDNRIRILKSTKL